MCFYCRRKKTTKRKTHSCFHEKFHSARLYRILCRSLLFEKGSFCTFPNICVLADLNGFTCNSPPLQDPSLLSSPLSSPPFSLPGTVTSQPLHTEMGKCHSCAAPLCCQTGLPSLPVQRQPSPSSLECNPLDLTLYSEFFISVDEGSNMKTNFSAFTRFPQTHSLQGVQFSCHGSHTKSPGKYKVQKK